MNNGLQEDRVVDFQIKVDKIDLRDTGVGNWSDLAFRGLTEALNNHESCNQEPRYDQAEFDAGLTHIGKHPLQH